jgi:hypothetical protein
MGYEVVENYDLGAGPVQFTWVFQARIRVTAEHAAWVHMPYGVFQFFNK